MIGLREIPSPEIAARLISPVLNASFASSIRFLFIIWPVLWLMGIEQLLLPFFIGAIFLLELVKTGGRIRYNTVILFSFLLGLWWLVPIFWVAPAHRDIFLKESATAWTQTLILVLFLNRIKSRRDFKRVVEGLMIFAWWLALGSLIYISGLWRGQLTSLVGMLLPASLFNNSAFFTSIGQRGFGALSRETIFFSHRVSSLALQVGGLSMILLILIPIVYWRLRSTRRLSRLAYSVLLFSLLAALLVTESRTAYLAFAAAAVLLVVLEIQLLERRNLPVLLLVAPLIALVSIAILYFAFTSLYETFESLFVASRQGSFNTRTAIYRETIRLYVEHPIAGWGQPIPIPGLRTVFSAGTHSSYLGMLFQHGIVGLLLYLGLLFSIWQVVIRGLRSSQPSREVKLFWAAMAMALFAFNIRESAASWWWDQSITIVVWTAWGLILAAGQLSQQKNQTIDATMPS